MVRLDQVERFVIGFLAEAVGDSSTRKAPSPSLPILTVAFSRNSAGAAAFSIGVAGVEETIAYIRGQEEHHRKVSFQDEFRQLLRRYEIEFDERYVWD
mgnify:CR=1 FL=1